MSTGSAGTSSAATDAGGLKIAVSQCASAVNQCEKYNSEGRQFVWHNRRQEVFWRRYLWQRISGASPPYSGTGASSLALRRSRTRPCQCALSARLHWSTSVQANHAKNTQKINFLKKTQKKKIIQYLTEFQKAAIMQSHDCAIFLRTFATGKGGLIFIKLFQFNKVFLVHLFIC